MAYRKLKKPNQLIRVYRSWINCTQARVPTKTQTIFVVAHTATHAKEILHEKFKTTLWHTGHTIVWVNEQTMMEKLPIGTVIINKPEKY